MKVPQYPQEPVSIYQHYDDPAGRQAAWGREAGHGAVKRIHSRPKRTVVLVHRKER